MQLRRVFSKLKKIFRGGPLIAITLPREAWETQFERGKWDRLIATPQPNTSVILKYIDEETRRRGHPLRVLDLGCGNGALGEMLTKEKITVAQYIGIDISETALQKARTLYPSGTFIAGDLGGSFWTEYLRDADIVVCNEVLYYVPVQPFLQKLQKGAGKETVIVFSYYRSWRSVFLGLAIRRFLRDVRLLPDYGFPLNGKWTIVSGYSNLWKHE